MKPKQLAALVLIGLLLVNFLLMAFNKIPPLAFWGVIAAVFGLTLTFYGMKK